MDPKRIKGQTVLITGASSGIGKACAEEFAALGLHLVITARRIDRLETLAQELSSKYGIKVFPFQLDVRYAEEVKSVFRILAEKKIDVDILINNAGLALASDKLQDGDIDNWETMIDTNVKGLLYVTKAALPRMIQRDRGHIVNIGSVAGQGCYTAGNVYCATKHAVKALSTSLRLDLYGTAIRVTEIAPGAVETEFSEVRWNDKERASKFYQGFKPLVGKDIADAIVYCTSTEPHVNVAEMTIYPQAQAALNQIYRGESNQKNIFDNKK